MKIKIITITLILAVLLISSCGDRTTEKTGISKEMPEETLKEPWYVHQSIELTFHQAFPPENGVAGFTSLFASYMHLPEDNHLYIRTDDSGDNPLSGWIGVTKLEHNSPEYIINELPHDQTLKAGEHLVEMNRMDSIPDSTGMEPG